MKNFLLALFFVSSIFVCIGCGQQLAKDTPGQTNTNTINLERQFQRVVHYDCAKKITADGIETVSSPTKWVEVDPNDPRTMVDSSFVNTRNGSPAGIIMDHIRFVVDYSYGALSMHVEPGINVISYKFLSVTETVQEAGTVTLDVQYKETNLPGELDVDDCPPPSPTPTPTPAPNSVPVRK